MRILAFYPYVPYPLNRGAYYRGFYLLRSLAASHDVDLLALAEEGEGSSYQSVFEDFCHCVEIVPFRHPEWEKLIPRRLCNRLPSTVAHWRLPHVGAALARMLAANRYDAVHIFDIILAQYFLGGHSGLPVVIDRTRVDLQYQLMERRHMRPDWRKRLLNLENLSKLWLYERRVANRSSLQVVCGPDDEAFVRRYVSRPLNLAVVPNGVDTEYFNRDPHREPKASEPAVLFCGAMDYNPNVDALRWFFSEIYRPLLEKVPDLQVWIVGKDPLPEVRAYSSNANVRVTGAVPDVRPYYSRAWLQIVPLRIGGGTRLKIVESMAMGTPVVSTTIGAQGLALEHGKDILLADSAADFAQQTAAALRDPSLRQALEVVGEETVRTTLGWPMLGKRLIAAYARQFSKDSPLQAVQGSPRPSPV